THFMGVLEHTLEILKPYAPKPLEWPLTDTETEDSVDRSTEWNNNSSRLEVEESSDGFQRFLVAPDLDQSIRKEIEQGPGYEAEMAKDSYEQNLAGHYFFRDVMYLFAGVKGGWTSYQEGKDFAAISVTINTKITFVRDLQEEYHLQFPANVDYWDKVNVPLGAQCRSRKIDEDCLESAEGYEITDAYMLTTFRLVCELQDKGPTACLQDPETRDENTPWHNKTHKEKQLDNRSRLREVYSLLDFISKFSGKGRMPEDELIRGVREMAPGNPIPVWLVFAFHCFLTAQHSLGKELDRPFMYLKELAATVRSLIEDVKDFHKSMSMTCWPMQESQLTEVVCLIDAWLAKDYITEGLHNVSVDGRI
ncbi:MAG: hypothetical protein Q9169_008727, partial [Polycauliona sp. 2 TL-2023]